jgi:ABC-type antimicrobial peptide transport system permease subunit
MQLKDKSLSVGFFLATRDIKRSNPWTTGLIVFVMMLTFFNMTFLNGIFIGLIQGMRGTYKLYYSSDVFITPSIEKNIIEESTAVKAVVKSLPTFKDQSSRYTAPATLEYGYKIKIKVSDISESAGGLLVGIDPVAEERVTNLSKKIVAGSYLDSTDMDSIIVGSSLIQKYTTAKSSTDSDGSKILKTADIGSRVRLTANGIQKEVVIKGVISTNNSTVDGRIYMTDVAMRGLLGRDSLNVNEIAVSLQPGASDVEAKKYIRSNLSNEQDILIRASEETIPGGSLQMIKTFTLLGNMVAIIALFVGAITIFIVIYVNAITRRKFIGILKGIGITSRTIEISYIFQALFYAFSGIIIASILLLGFIVPYSIINPIQYPVGEGSLAITTNDVVIRAIILTITAFISGFIPAWLVTKQNTLDAILGR